MVRFQQNSGNKYFFAATMIILCLGTILCIPSFGSIVGSQETNSSPNYLILLVHGINTTHRVFMGHGENGSDVSRIPDDEKYPYGDLKGYLENTLGLKGYVYAYTFSERDGRISLAAEELGNSNHDNKAATIGGTLHYDKVGKEIGRDATGINDFQNGVRTGQGNSWLKQAREDFKKWYAENVLHQRGHPELVPESVIPHRYIIIAHSLGGSRSNVHRVSLGGAW